jgi:hypothetical protein
LSEEAFVYDVLTKKKSIIPTNSSAIFTRGKSSVKGAIGYACFDITGELILLGDHFGNITIASLASMKVCFQLHFLTSPLSIF